MKQFAMLLATLLLLSSTTKGQDRHYYSDERQIPIELAEKWNGRVVLGLALPFVSVDQATRSCY